MLEAVETLANGFTEMNPHVTFDIVVNENEAFKDAINRVSSPTTRRTCSGLGWR